MASNKKDTHVAAVNLARRWSVQNEHDLLQVRKLYNVTFRSDLFAGSNVLSELLGSLLTVSSAPSTINVPWLTFYGAWFFVDRKTY